MEAKIRPFESTLNFPIWSKALAFLTFCKISCLKGVSWKEMKSPLLAKYLSFLGLTRPVTRASQSVIMKLTVVMEMELYKEFDVEVKWEVNKEVAKDILMFIMC